MNYSAGIAASILVALGAGELVAIKAPNAVAVIWVGV